MTSEERIARLELAVQHLEECAALLRPLDEPMVDGHVLPHLEGREENEPDLLRNLLELELAKLKADGR